jgi:hypothetical protein
MTKGHVVYICLSCSHTKQRFINRKDYTETIECSKCEETMVDVWVRHKYEKKGNEDVIKRNVVIMKSGQRLVVNGDVHLFNEDSPGILNSKVPNHFNSKEIRLITQDDLQGWSNEQLINELKKREEVNIVDPDADAYAVQVDLTDERTKLYTIIKNNFDEGNRDLFDSVIYAKSPPFLK